MEGSGLEIQKLVDEEIKKRREHADAYNAAETLLAMLGHQSFNVEEDDDEDYREEVDDSPLVTSSSVKRNFRELLSKIPLSYLFDEEEEKEGGNGKVNFGKVASTSSSSKALGLRAGEGIMDFPALYFMCAVRNAMVILMGSIDHGAHNFQGLERAEDEEQVLQVPSFSLSDIMEKLITLHNGDERILGSREKPPAVPLEVATRGALTVLSVRPPGRIRAQWAALTSHDEETGRWSWVGPRPRWTADPDDLRRRLPIQVEMAHHLWGLSKSMVDHLVSAFRNWLGTELRYAAAVSALQSRAAPVGLHDLMRYMAKLRTACGAMFKVPLVSFPALRRFFQEEERVRYAVPEKVFYYTAVDGAKSAVAPVYSCKRNAPRRRSKQIRADSPGGVSLLSVVRDAACRLPFGEGSIRDVYTLVTDSQYLAPETLRNPAKLFESVANAVNRLKWEKDSSVEYARLAGRRGFWFYRHRTRGPDDFPEEGRGPSHEYYNKRRRIQE